MTSVIDAFLLIMIENILQIQYEHCCIAYM